MDNQRRMGFCGKYLENLRWKYVSTDSKVVFRWSLENWMISWDAFYTMPNTSLVCQWFTSQHHRRQVYSLISKSDLRKGMNRLFFLQSCQMSKTERTGLKREEWLHVIDSSFSWGSQGYDTTIEYWSVGPSVTGKNQSNAVVQESNLHQATFCQCSAASGELENCMWEVETYHLRDTNDAPFQALVWYHIVLRPILSRKNSQIYILPMLCCVRWVLELCVRSRNVSLERHKWCSVVIDSREIRHYSVHQPGTWMNVHCFRVL